LVEEKLMKRKNSISLRLATVFGMSPRMRIDLLVNNFVYKAMFDKYLILFESNFKRNYVHVRDVSRAFVHCINNFKKLSGNIFNLGLEDANLSKKELEIKKQAFDQEKKARIAQAVMSGFQGALQAFLGPFSNPALVASGAAPIIGALLAGLVATQTGIQVAAIRNTKFDTSGTTQITQPTDTGFASGNLSGGGTSQNQLSQLGGGFTSFNSSSMGQNSGGTSPFSNANSQNAPQKVYVLESDISAAQQRVRVLEGAATFG